MAPAVGANDLPATVRLVPVDASGRWLTSGGMDIRRAPGVSLGYGAAFSIASLALAGGLFFRGLAVVMPLLGHASWNANRDVIEPR